MVLRLLAPAAGFIKIRHPQDKEVIENKLSRIHYRLTPTILFASCILCTATGLIGKQIDCIHGSSFKNIERVVNTYCWITSTFTLPISSNKIVGTHVVSHGVGPYVRGEDEVVYHAYYQWVPFVLFFQGILFYFPHWFWKAWEGGTIKWITTGLRERSLDKESRTKNLNNLVKYLNGSLNYNFKYAAGSVVCETISIVSLIINLFLLDKFFGGTFLKYGIQTLSFIFTEQENRTDPMIARFPRLTKCDFHKFGSSGTIERIDALCILPINVMNEKIFIVLWFWFILVTILVSASLLYTLAMILYTPVRKVIIRHLFKFKISPGVDTLLAKLEAGDFVLLHLLSQNMSSSSFQELLEKFTSKLCDGDDDEDSNKESVELKEAIPENEPS